VRLVARSAPGEDGLFEVYDSGLASLDGNFVELIEDCGGGRVHVGSHQWDGDHGARALRNVSQIGDIGSPEFLEAHPVDLGNFRRVWVQLGFASSPDHHWCDDETRAGGVVVENSEYGSRREFESDFFRQLAKSSLFGGFARVQSSPGQRVLARVVFHLARAQRQYKTGFAFVVGEQGQCHRCGSQAVARNWKSAESAQIGFDAGSQCFVQARRSVAHCKSIPRCARGLAPRRCDRQTLALMLSRVHRRKIALPNSAIEIALLDWGGEGPLALLHHATGFCAGVWAPVAELLKEHYRVIAMDARGHGDSTKPEGADAYHWELFGRDVLGVAEVLAAEHPEGRVALGVGHSIGGSSILMASGVRPDLFERTVLVDPVIFPQQRPKPASAPDSPGNQLAERARKRRQVWPSREAARGKWLEKELFSSWVPEAMDLYLAEGLADRPDGQVELKCSGEIEAAIFEATGSFDLWSSADRVRTPTLIEWATRGIFSRANFEKIAARMGDAQVCDIDAGHLAPMQYPDRVVAPILKFASLTH